MPTFQVTPERIKEVLRFLKTEATPRFRRLDDLTALDESARRERHNYPDYTLVYQLLSFDPPTRVRLKVPLRGDSPAAGSITDIWPSANWYERECYDMFGIRFDGHPRLWRLLMPHDWEGHPLRKSYPD
ncbi:MAG: NADH-quinone oxidoreductase subunit C, partial [Syntrophobacterales bacterium]|nr:NADH-quinone oxidoreductase subunit C [Syntrophobacterales bacterium]